MLTKEDVDFLIHILTAVDPQYPVAKGDEVAHRLKELKKLWNDEGLPIAGMEIVWHGTIRDSVIHTYNVGDTHRDFFNWRVTRIKAYAVEHNQLPLFS
uniref:Uncharacterized protein n=1 Tax=viral metagenome TaxID=1070528 RepID=A0A6M3LW04_9ZZZZ